MTGDADRPRLVAVIDGTPVGRVFQHITGTFRFVYDEAWRRNPQAYPVSLSLPLAAEEHAHAATSAFLWGLLPDNERTLSQYGRLFGVSPGNPVALLTHIGADCAGAVQFVSPEQVDHFVGTVGRPASVDWMTVAEVASELRTVRENGIPGATRRTVGQFSLAGAQPKIALLEQNGRWGRPKGRMATNRILKPPARDFRGFAENEHFCLELVGALGLGSVRSRVLTFEDEIAIVVDRFDRATKRGSHDRIHQEDICQALGVMPTRKYENEGGPGIATIIALLRDVSQRPQEDVERFLGAMIVNWVIAATDGHAKNYALLHAAGGRTRLAPFYDIASYLPYAEPELHRVKLAMKVGSQYLVRRVGRGSWESLAKKSGLSTAFVLEQIDQILTEIPDAVDRTLDRAIADGLNKSVLRLVARRIKERARTCAESF